MKESKEERFKRVAEARVNKIIKMVQLLGNCSNTATYAFDNEQVIKIFVAIEGELAKAKLRYAYTEKVNKQRFKLSDKSLEDTDMKTFDISVIYDAIISVKANNEDDAEEKVRRLTCDEMYEKSDGTWDIGDVIKVSDDEEYPSER